MIFRTLHLCTFAVIEISHIDIVIENIHTDLNITPWDLNLHVVNYDPYLDDDS
jgi:hypothetical protein